MLLYINSASIQWRCLLWPHKSVINNSVLIQFSLLFPFQFSCHSYSRMSTIGSTELIATTAVILPLSLCLCTLIICIGIRYGIKKWKWENPAISDTEACPDERQRAAVVPLFSAHLQASIHRDSPPPYNQLFVQQPSNDSQSSRVAMETSSEIPPPQYEESVTTHSTTRTVEHTPGYLRLSDAF